MSHWVCRFLAPVALVGHLAGTDSLSLHGTVEPPMARGLAAVSAVESPFYFERPVQASRFAFRRLEPGAYTLTVMDPEWGVTRTTVQVTPSFADPDGRVHVTVDLERSDAARSQRVEQQGKVSVATLKVSAKARTIRRKAQARLRKGDEAGGTALLLKAVEISPSYTDVWNELGTIAYKAGRYVEAEQRFRRALEIDPLAYAPMVNLGGALLSQNRFEEALSFNLMARSMEPQDALANSQLGMNFFYKGQFEKAEEFLLRAKEADPSHFSFPQLFLAEIHAKQGELSRARAALEEVLHLHPDSPVRTLVHDALRRLDAATPSNR